MGQIKFYYILNFKIYKNIKEFIVVYVEKINYLNGLQ
jgi:hypothetical protein